MELKLLHRKEELIITTIEIINENGLQGLSTREVARRGGISESTIFKHFKSKNELILAVLEHFSQYDQAIMVSLEKRDIEPDEEISEFINFFTTYYENYPEITVILHSFASLIVEEDFRAIVIQIFEGRIAFVKNLVDKAIAAGRFKAQTNSEYLADVICGSVRLINLKWRMQGYNFPLREQTEATLQSLLEAYR